MPRFSNVNGDLSQVSKIKSLDLKSEKQLNVYFFFQHRYMNFSEVLSCHNEFFTLYYISENHKNKKYFLKLFKSSHAYIAAVIFDSLLSWKFIQSRKFEVGIYKITAT